jgi:two-component system sensor histidine kinase BaeS
MSMCCHPSRHSRSAPGRRPPWWPENEPWPPVGGWRSVRRRFIRRMALVLAGVVVLVAVASTIWNVMSTHYQGRSPGPGFVPWVPVVVVIVIAAVLIGRVLRRTAAPIGDVMDAANRLAAGDYSTRVEERGSGEVRQLIDSFNEMAERLQTSEEQRQALLAEVAHELRTPLSVMHGDLEGMLDGVYPRDDPHLQPVLEGTKRMTRLLEDLQTLSTAQAGALRLYRESMDPARLVDDVVAAFAPQAAARGIALSAKVEGVPELDADPVRLRQVFDNLVANSLRFTPAGGSVVISASASDGFAVFSVADTGAGMPPDQLAHLFERFSRSGDAKGSGLGLAIARSLVESHGGTIEADSRPGRGTTITFRLPLAVDR